MLTKLLFSQISLMVAELIVDLHVKDVFCMCQDKREMSLHSSVGKEKTNAKFI